MISPTRWLLIVLFVAAAAWLALDGSPVEARRGAVERALEAGTIGGLSAKEEAELAAELERLARAGGLLLPVALNRPFTDGALNVFTTSPAAQEVTGNGRGNALYDAVIDAIFLDLDIVRPTRVLPMYGDLQVDEFHPSEPGAWTYLEFLFLHELGHRIRHRGIFRTFDLRFGGDDDIQQRWEAEADDFALASLEALYTRKRIARPSGLDSDMLDLPYSLAPGDPHVVSADLASMVHERNLSLLFSGVPYSPFYSDRAHPTFVDRTLGLVDRSLARVTDPGVRTYVALSQEYLARLHRIGAAPLAEIHAPEPIVASAFDERGLLLLSRAGNLLRVTREDLDEALSCGRPSVASVRPEFTAHEPGALNTHFPAFVSLPGVGPAVSTREEWLTPRDGVWRPIFTEPKVLSGKTFVVGPDAFVLASEERLRAFRGGREVAQASVAELAYRVYRRGSPAGVTISLAVAFRDRVYVEVRTKADWNLAGVAALSLDKLEVLEYTPLRLDLPWAQKLADRARVVVAPREQGAECYLVDTTFVYSAAHQEPYELQVWRASSTEPPQLLATHRLVADKLGSGDEPSQWYRRASVLVMGAAWMSDHPGIAINIFMDSAYFFDLTSRELSVLFHPGGSTMEVGHGGEVAFCGRGGFKCYVVRTKGGTNS